MVSGQNNKNASAPASIVTGLGMPVAGPQAGLAVRLQGLPGPQGAARAPAGPVAGQAAKPAFAGRTPRFLHALGLTYEAMGMPEAAMAALRAATEAAPSLAPAWVKLGDLLRAAGDAAGAEAASRAARPDGQSHGARVPPAKLSKVLESEGRLVAALQRPTSMPPAMMLRAHLVANPEDAAALRLLGGLARGAGELERAEALLARALDLAPGYMAARQDYCDHLLARNRWADALAQLDHLIAQRPHDRTLRIQRADALANIGKSAEAIEAYEAELKHPGPGDPRLWLSYGVALRSAGRAAESALAFRNCIALQPSMGEAYWGLAGLRGTVLTGADIEAMRTQLAESGLPVQQRFHFHYALGQALEKQGCFADSFHHYEAGARLRASMLRGSEAAYDAAEVARRAARAKAFFTAASCAVKSEAGTKSPVPIFVVGMPRSGSTLIEQILASHSQIEGLQELRELGHIVKRLGAASPYPECLANLNSAGLARLGDEYIDRCAAYRKTDQPFFIDKMPGNWTNIGLIQMILPHARIIDARRNPMACGFGTFKQLIVGGANYSLDLADIGQRYRTYADLMAHFATVLPGRVHLVRYEAMVRDTEAEIRALLAYCGVAFEAQCLRFWETDRTVRTPSSEQVRQPIFREGLDQWRHFEPWLGALKTALGPALTCEEAGA